MTGEITLRGRVLPIGGLKSKILAAHLSGARMVILPQKNEKDLRDIPEEIRKQMKLVLVDSMDQVLEAALRRRPQPLKVVAAGGRRAGDTPLDERPAAPTRCVAASRRPSSHRPSSHPWRAAPRGRRPGPAGRRRRSGSLRSRTAADGVPRLLRHPGRAPDGQPGRHQEGVPQARAQAPPGRQHGRPDGRAALQGGQRGQRRSCRDPEKRKLYDQLGADWEAYQRAARGRRRARPRCARAASPAGVRFEYHGRPRGPGRLQRLLPHLLRGRRRAADAGSAAPSRRRATATRRRGPRRPAGLDGLDRRREHGRAHPARRHRRAPGAPAMRDAPGRRGTSRRSGGQPRGGRHGHRPRWSRSAIAPGGAHPAGRRHRPAHPTLGQGRRGPGRRRTSTLTVKVRPHRVFTPRRRRPAPRAAAHACAEALLGAEVPVGTLAGGRCCCAIPPGTQTGRTFRLRGQGLPRFKGGGPRRPLRARPRRAARRASTTRAASWRTPSSTTSSNPTRARAAEAVRAATA